MPAWTTNELRAIFRRSGGRCHICKRNHTLAGYPQHWNVDHLQPKSLGGSDDVRNLAVSCKSCNTGKANNFDMRDLVAGVSNEVVDRLQNGSGSRSRGRYGERGSGRSGGGSPGGSRQGGGGQQRSANQRRGRCDICGAIRPLKGSFCNNCYQKTRNRQMVKKAGECAYGRCTQPVKSMGFFGIGATRYCERHQNQHDRGLI